MFKYEDHELRERITILLENLQEKTFSWGTYDCTHFLQEIYEVKHDTKIQIVRPKYSNKKEALAYLEQPGMYLEYIKKYYKQVTEKELKIKENKYSAEYGDVVYKHEVNGKLPGIGLCLGRKCVFLSEKDIPPFIFLDLEEIDLVLEI